MRAAVGRVAGPFPRSTHAPPDRPGCRRSASSPRSGPPLGRVAPRRRAADPAVTGPPCRADTARGRASPESDRGVSHARLRTTARRCRRCRQRTVLAHRTARTTGRRYGDRRRHRALHRRRPTADLAADRRAGPRRARRAALAPQVRDLQRRYADDPVALQREVFALYREAGANPIAGCLPLLLQAPFLLVLYRLFTTSEGGAGCSTSGSPVCRWVTISATGWPARPARCSAYCLWCCWRSRGGRRGGPAGRRRRWARWPVRRPRGRGRPRSGGLPLLPFTTVLVALVLPLAAVIYLVTTSVWSAPEQAVLRRPQAVPSPAGR